MFGYSISTIQEKNRFISCAMVLVLCATLCVLFFVSEEKRKNSRPKIDIRLIDSKITKSPAFLLPVVINNDQSFQPLPLQKKSMEHILRLHCTSQPDTT